MLLQISKCSRKVRKQHAKGDPGAVGHLQAAVRAGRSAGLLAWLQGLAQPAALSWLAIDLCARLHGARLLHCSAPEWQQSGSRRSWACRGCA